MIQDLSFFPGNDAHMAFMAEWPSYLTQPRIETISQRLNEKLEHDRLYLRQHYTLRNLATELDIPWYQLSAYFNRIHGTTYPDFINQCRVNFCRELLAQDDYRHYNLRGLATLCGFGNRNTLTTVFQKYTGYTPSAYIKIIRTSR